MKLQMNFSNERWLRWLSVLTIIILIGLAGGCGKPQGAQVTTTGWEAQRFNLFEKVWASINSVSVLDRLDNTWKTVLLNGYVTTDSNGQGKMRKGTCTFYIFQGSGFIVTEEVISTCPEGSGSSGCSNVSTAVLNNCGIRVVTLPATVSFKGTTVTIIEYRDLGTVVVLTSEGTAIVTPADNPDKPFEVGAPFSAYYAAPEFQQAAFDFFGFGPGELVEFEKMVVPIEKMELTPQIQSANLVLISEQVPIIPVNPAYQIGFQWLDREKDFNPLADVIGQAVDWRSVLADTLFRETPFIFDNQGQRTDLRFFPYNPDNALSLMASSSYLPGQALTIAFDESIPDMGFLAEIIKRNLEERQLFVVNLIPFNPDSWDKLLSQDMTISPPTLILGGIAP